MPKSLVADNMAKPKIQPLLILEDGIFPNRRCVAVDPYVSDAYLFYGLPVGLKISVEGINGLDGLTYWN